MHLGEEEGEGGGGGGGGHRAGEGGGRRCPPRSFPCRWTAGPISRESARASNPVQTDVVRPSDGGESAAAATTVVHRLRKSDTNLLGVSRAFGDYDYKSNAELPPSGQAVVCTPDIALRERADDEDMYLILACDGIWDVMSNDSVGEFVARRVEERRDSSDDNDEFLQEEVLPRVGGELLTAFLNAGSRDFLSSHQQTTDRACI